MHQLSDCMQYICIGRHLYAWQPMQHTWTTSTTNDIIFGLAYSMRPFSRFDRIKSFRLFDAVVTAKLYVDPVPILHAHGIYPLAKGTLASAHHGQWPCNATLSCLCVCECDVSLHVHVPSSLTTCACIFLTTIPVHRSLLLLYSSSSSSSFY